MSKKSMIIWIFGLLILVFLYLLSSTDLIIKDATKPIYQISIILKENKDELYTNLKKGIEKAATEFNVDTNIISIVNVNEISTSALIDEEIQEGANAIIIEPNIETENIENKDCPFVVIGDEKYSFIHSSLKFSYKELSLELAKNIEKKEGKIKEIYIFSHNKDTYDNKEIYKSIKEYFKDSKINLIDNKEDETLFRNSIEELVLYDKEKPVFIASDSYSLNLIAKILSDSDVYRNKIKAVYGFTYNTYILNKIDEGIITGTMAFNDYELGYLAIKTAVAMIRKEVAEKEYQIDSRYIDKIGLDEEENIRFLYPIE